MPNIVGIAGSLRKASYNAALLRAAVELAPSGMTVELASIRAIPLYDGDVEAEQGLPEAARALKDRIAEADGLLLITPEYNNSIPGVLKNTIDWLSRPSSDIRRVFGHLPVAVMGASQGRYGTMLAQAAWLPVLRSLGTRPWFGPRVLVGNAKDVFDESGSLVDDGVRSQVREFMAGFAAFAVRPTASAQLHLLPTETALK
jgi:chromate reductase, NAD(P)H dehydrogenase (quinone)